MRKGGAAESREEEVDATLVQRLNRARKADPVLRVKEATAWAATIRQARRLAKASLVVGEVVVAGAEVMAEVVVVVVGASQCLFGRLRRLSDDGVDSKFLAHILSHIPVVLSHHETWTVRILLEACWSE